MTPTLSIVLVTWNSARWLPVCLEAVRAQTLREVEVIGVDNASSDGSAALLAERANRVIRNEENRGFSAAVNQAVAVARGEFVLLVNPDCRLAPDYAERLVAALREAGERFGAATGLLVRASGDAIEPSAVIDSLGIRMTRTGRHLDLGQGEPVERAVEVLTANLPPRAEGRGPRAEGSGAKGEGSGARAEGRGATGEGSGAPAAGGSLFYEVFGVSGAAALYRASFLRAVAIGGEALDVDFFAWREDADLAWRGRLFGWRALCQPAAVAWHVRRVTPESRRELPAAINMHSVKNRFLLRIKNEGIGLALRHAPFELARDAVVIAAALTIERSSLPALSWIWQNRARLLAKRRDVQRRRSVSDRQLAEWFR